MMLLLCSVSKLKKFFFGLNTFAALTDIKEHRKY